MAGRVLAWAAALAILIGAGAYTFRLLDRKSFEVAEAVSDACYARHGTGLARDGDVPEAVRSRCTRPIRDYEAGRIWRAVMAASVGATAAMLIIGGIVIVLGARRRSGS